MNMPIPPGQTICTGPEKLLAFFEPTPIEARNISAGVWHRRPHECQHPVFNFLHGLILQDITPLDPNNLCPMFCPSPETTHICWDVSNLRTPTWDSPKLFHSIYPASRK